MKNVVILNFSGRKNGNCTAIANHIARNNNRTNVYTVQISGHFDPCGGCDYQCLRNDLVCPKLDTQILEIIDHILKAELIYYIIPNYCGAPCANYYAFNERSVGWINGDKQLLEQYMQIPKRFIMISNSATDAFKEVIAQNASGNAKVLYLASSKYGVRSIDGNLLDNENAKADLDRFLSDTY